MSLQSKINRDLDYFANIDRIDHVTNKKAVRIVLNRNTYFVEYVNRKPGGRHCAARFYAPDYTLETVQQWVKNNHKLTLEN